MSEPAPETSSGALPGDLPDLHVQRLDVETLERLFADVAVFGEVIEAKARAAPGEQMADRPLTLDEAAGHFLGRAVAGVQIRYRFEGAQWWDTLLWQGEAARLVRIRHDFNDGRPRRPQEAGP